MFSSCSSSTAPAYFLSPGSFNPLRIYGDDILGRKNQMKDTEKSYMRRLKLLMEQLLKKQFNEPSRCEASALKNYGRLSRASDSERPLVFQELMFRITVLGAKYFDPCIDPTGKKVYTGDKILGRALFHIAAEAGFSEAIYRLGCCFEKGEGGPQDLSVAKTLYRLSHFKGNRGAYHALDRLGHSPHLFSVSSSSFMTMTPDGEVTIHDSRLSNPYTFYFLEKSDFLNMT